MVGGDRDEVGAALPVLPGTLANQAQERLVDESRRLERVSGAFPTEVRGRQAVQLTIDNLDDLAQRGLIAQPPILQQDGDRYGWGSVHIPFGGHYKGETR